MSQLKCSRCGNTFWSQIRPEEFNEDQFIVWGKEPLKPMSSPITALVCLRCGRVELPATSMAGKNMLSPEVQAYIRLLEGLPDINAEYVLAEAAIELNEIEHPGFATKDDIQQLAGAIDNLGTEVEKLKKDCQETKSAIVKEKADVKAGKRSK